MLVRDRLLRRLDRRWVEPVLVLAAPAGYGKTTLLVQAMTHDLRTERGIDCWLSCRPEHAAASRLGEDLRQALSAPTFPMADPGIDDLTSAIVDAVWRRAPQQVALVLDDIEEIPADSDAAGLLARLLDRLPTNGHLVMAGRRRPPLPLARLDLKGQLVAIDEDDLTFTDGELAEFARLRGVAISNLEASGGWPALAELLARARRQVAREYVAEEVLSGLPLPRRRDIALLARLGRFDRELAEAVLGPDVDVEDLLEGLPLVTRLGEGEWSVHGLWRMLLERAVTPAEVAQAQRRAGRVLLRRGRIPSAIELLLAAEAWDDLAGAIVEALGSAHPPVARDVLARWLERLPADVRSAPSGQLLAAVLTADNRADLAWHELQECASRFREAGHLEGELACLVQLGQLAWWTDRSEALALVAARVFELEAAGCATAIPLACLGRALLHDLGSNWSEALRELGRIPAGSLNQAWLGIVSWIRAIQLLALGLAPDAQQAAEEALVHTDAFYAPLAEITRLHALWYQGRLREVTEVLPPLVGRIRGSGHGNQAALAAAQCSMVHAMQGLLRPAVDHLAEARGAAAALDDAPLVDTALSVAAAVLAVAAGDEDAARATLEAYVERYPIGEGIAVAAQQRYAAPFYVLVPATRAAFDRADVGPAWELGRTLARAVAAVREGRPLPAGTPVLDRADLVQAHLPLPWVADLGVAAVAAGRAEGLDLLGRTWPQTRDHVRRIAHDPNRSRRRAAWQAIGCLAVPPSRRMELLLLGEIELWEEGLPVDRQHWRRGRVRSLLAYLVVNGTASRDQLGADLWPNLDPEGRSRNLRVTLSYLLRVLEPERGPRDASFFIRLSGQKVSLHTGDWFTSDLWEFDTSWRGAVEADQQGSPEAALNHALEAVRLWRGEPTELMANLWAVAPFEQRRIRCAELATRAGELLVACGETRQARDLAEQALDLEPWHEAAHRLVITAHRSLGDARAAGQAIDRYREAMREVGLDLHIVETW